MSACRNWVAKSTAVLPSLSFIDASAPCWHRILAISGCRCWAAKCNGVHPLWGRLAIVDVGAELDQLREHFFLTGESGDVHEMVFAADAGQVIEQFADELAMVLNQCTGLCLVA